MQNRSYGNLSNNLSDNLSTLNNQQRIVGKGKQSFFLISLFTLGILGFLGTRLAYLQLVEGSRYKTLADRNRIKEIAKRPVRGNIYDRQGKLLASNRISHSAFIIPRIAKENDWPKVRKYLATTLNIPESTIQEEIEKVNPNSAKPLRIAQNLTDAQITALKEYSAGKDGIEIDIETIRHYPGGELAAHVLGYTGAITEKQFANRRSEGYRLGDVIGQSGVESAFETLLRGEWGGRQLEVDSKGEITRDLGQRYSKPGGDLHLTIDLELQKAAEKTLGNRRGAIIALDPNNGSVLAMTSRPTFDPNIFSGPISKETWQKVQGKDHPLLNRSLRVFPPASTFKIVTTTAALESSNGKYTPATRLQTYPFLKIGGTIFADWNHAGFGILDFQGAMKWSSDTFFYQIAQGIGGPTLIDWTRRYGFGEKTGIELSEDSKGLVADDEWTRKYQKKPWGVGDSVNMSIGQGYLQTSPLQVARMFAVPANGGDLVKPHLLKDDGDAKKWRQSLNLKPSTIKVLREGLRAVVDGGTAPSLNSPTIPPSAGKTGTAEAPPGENHVWYGGYAPYDKPEILVVVFGEHSGGGGGKIAAPMALEVLQAYFSNKNKSPLSKPISSPKAN
jgi:penicillin-binding protein 2